MGMMLPRITTNYHAYSSLVYPILFSISLNNISISQEDNDQAFLVTL
jgi:hypothetical protein